MNWSKLKRRIGLRLRSARLLCEVKWFELKAWKAHQKLRYLRWKKSKFETLDELGESYRFQHGENDD